MFRRMNKQVRRTREWVFGALLSLLGKKPYDEIKIATIAEEAGVARQSFYRNYANKDDIVCQYFITLLDSYTDKINEHYGSIPLDSVEEYVSPKFARDVFRMFYELLFENREDIMKLKNASLSHMFDMAVREYINDLRRSIIGVSPDKLYLLAYQFGGVSSITVEWIEREMSDTPEQMGQMLEETLRGADGGYPLIDSVLMMIRLNEEAERSRSDSGEEEDGEASGGRGRKGKRKKSKWKLAESSGV